jgi:hypothetical protein
VGTRDGSVDCDLEGASWSSKTCVRKRIDTNIVHAEFAYVCWAERCNERRPLAPQAICSEEGQQQLIRLGLGAPLCDIDANCEVGCCTSSVPQHEGENGVTLGMNYCEYQVLPTSAAWDSA